MEEQTLKILHIKEQPGVARKSERISCGRKRSIWPLQEDVFVCLNVSKCASITYEKKILKT